MKRLALFSPRARALATVLVCTLLLTPNGQGTGLQSGFHNPRQSGDPGGAGDIPFTGGPTNPVTFDVPVLSTLGRVVDSAGVGISRLSVVVTSAKGYVVGTGMTDGAGFFVLVLPVEAKLELAVLGTGVADVPVAAGVPVLIVLR